jgi:D-3-phosphoglycerate dehydrogenase
VRLKLSEEELADAVAGYDALVVRSESKVTGRVLEAGTNLKVVARAGVGVDNIDVRAATLCGIVVVNAPTGNTIAAAEHTVAMMLAAARRITHADASMRQHQWERARFMGTELRHKTLGLIGLGNIGAEVAKRAQGFEMRVIAYDPVVSVDRAEAFNVQLVELDALLEAADVISLHVPLVDSTRNMIGATQLQRAKPGLILINCARGGIVDEEALLQALNEERVAAVALDVFASEPPFPAGGKGAASPSPLIGHPRVTVTPHIAGQTHESQVGVAFDIADQVAVVLSGGAARYAVNAPRIPPEELAALAPYLELAEKAGRLAAQIGGERVSALEVAYNGEIAEYETSILTAEVIRGLMASFSETRVNPVNAQSVAAGHGISVVERRDRTPGVYSNLLTVSLKRAGGETVVAGTLALNEPRIVRLDGFSLDLVPRGHFLMSSHRDQPGVIGRIGTLLGESNINIAGMQLGRDQPRGRALMVMQVDEVIPPAVLDTVRQVPGMAELRFVVL